MQMIVLYPCKEQVFHGLHNIVHRHSFQVLFLCCFLLFFVVFLLEDKLDECLFTYFYVSFLENMGLIDGQHRMFKRV